MKRISEMSGDELYEIVQALQAGQRVEKFSKVAGWMAVDYPRLIPDDIIRVAPGNIGTLRQLPLRKGDLIEKRLNKIQYQVAQLGNRLFLVDQLLNATEFELHGNDVFRIVSYPPGDAKAPKS